MREEERIDRILKKINKYWHNNPDMRFNQMLINLMAIPDGQHWFWEDDDVEKNIDEVIKNEQK